MPNIKGKSKTDIISILYLLVGIALGIFALSWALPHAWTTWPPGMILIILSVPLILLYLGYLTFLLVFSIRDIGHKDSDTAIMVGDVSGFGEGDYIQIGDEVMPRKEHVQHKHD